MVTVAMATISMVTMKINNIFSKYEIAGYYKPATVK
jgi:hypothetical protein